MPKRILIGIFVAPALLVLWPTAAWATDGEGNYGSTSVGATVLPGSVEVSAGQSAGPSGPAQTTQDPHQGSHSTGTSDPTQPYGCTYTPASSDAQQLLGPGGAEPGQWMSVACAGPGVIDPMPAQWQTTAQPQPVDPAAVGDLASREATDAKEPDASGSGSARNGRS